MIFSTTNPSVIKNKQVLDKFSINIDLIRHIMYIITFIGIIITLKITFFPTESIIQTEKMRRFKYMIVDGHWIIQFCMIIIANILVNIVKIDTMNDTQQQDLIRLQQAVLIGSVLFVTAFLCNLGYTAALFYMGFAIWYIFQINILSPAPEAKSS
jgi:hypothetical protein